MNFQLRVIAWNPNGIRALFTKSASEVKKLCQIHDPDIIVWNEIKGNLSKHAEIEKVVTGVLPNYRWFWNHADKAGRHGVAISIKPHINILAISYGFGGNEKEPEGRLITLELESFYVIGIYGVNAGVDNLSRLEYKIEWILKLLQYMNCLKARGKHVIVIGDWNIAPTNIDVHDPRKLEGCAGFTVEERTVFKAIMNNGWVDVFRFKNPDKELYSFYSGRTKDGKKYGGWRIDHAIVNSELKLDHCKMQILKEYNGSDHVPILFHVSDVPICEIIKPLYGNAKLQIVSK